MQKHVEVPCHGSDTSQEIPRSLSSSLGWKLAKAVEAIPLSRDSGKYLDEVAKEKAWGSALEVMALAVAFTLDRPIFVLRRGQVSSAKMSTTHVCTTEVTQILSLTK